LETNEIEEYKVLANKVKDQAGEAKIEVNKVSKEKED